MGQRLIKSSSWMIENWKNDKDIDSLIKTIKKTEFSISKFAVVSLLRE